QGRQHGSEEDPGRALGGDDRERRPRTGEVQGRRTAQPDEPRRRRPDQGRQVRQGAEERADEGAGAIEAVPVRNDLGARTGPRVLLEVRGLTARYGPVVAVRDVDLRVGEGEIVALLGANGAGKTTTLMSIVGLHRARTGTIELDGREIGHLPPERVVRRGVGLAPEGRRIFAGLTVAENLRLGAAGAGRLRDEEGVTILLVEQNVHQALRSCDRAYLMRVGGIEAEGTPEELRRDRRVQAAYLGVPE